MRVGECLKAWREKHDLTVRHFAPMIGISIATLSRIERGGQMDAETQLKLIAYLFGSGNQPSQEHADDRTGAQRPRTPHRMAWSDRDAGVNNE